ncbi:MAG: response regulator [Clostridia bacterium]|nr:response regulator [Clostridia bacterium]
MILIVDDEYFVTELMKRKLSDLKVKSITANSLESAKELVSKSSDIELVIMDLHFPQENGREFAVWLQKHHPNIKRIAVTAHSYEVHREKSEEELFDHIFQKPVDFENDLILCIKRYLRSGE